MLDYGGLCMTSTTRRLAHENFPAGFCSAKWKANLLATANSRGRFGAISRWSEPRTTIARGLEKRPLR